MFHVSTIVMWGGSASAVPGIQVVPDKLMKATASGGGATLRATRSRMVSRPDRASNSGLFHQTGVQCSADKPVARGREQRLPPKSDNDKAVQSRACRQFPPGVPGTGVLR